MSRAKRWGFGAIVLLIAGAVFFFGRKPEAPSAPSLVPEVHERLAEAVAEGSSQARPGGAVDEKLWRQVQGMPTADLVSLCRNPELFEAPVCFKLLVKGEYAIAIPKALELLDKDPMLYVLIGENAQAPLSNALFQACSFDPELNWSSTKDAERADEMRAALARLRRWWESRGKHGDPDAWGKEHAEELVAKIRAQMKDGNQSGAQRLYLVQATGNLDALADWAAFERWWETHKGQSRPEWVRGLIGAAITDLASDNDTVRIRAAFRLDDYGLFPAHLPDTLTMMGQLVANENTIADFERSARDISRKEAKPLADWWAANGSRFHLVCCPAFGSHGALWYVVKNDRKHWNKP